MGLGGTFVSTCYTHHQKTVVVDAALPDSDLRRLVAFVGGLDLTDGRFDTPEFPLFSSLQTLHKGDFYQVGEGRRASVRCEQQPVAELHSRGHGGLRAQGALARYTRQVKLTSCGLARLD